MRVSILAMTDLIAQTAIEHTKGVWEPEDFYDDASALAEFAGRQCYESWNRPNPATATNEGYLANIIAQQHLSVVEHGTVSFLVTGVSRSLTHELVRHRHASYSQLSQRYVNMTGLMPVIPPMYRDDHGVTDPDTNQIIMDLWDAAVMAYERLYDVWHARLTARGVGNHRATKMAREAARCVLPNMTPTQIVFTMNHSAIRHFLAKRGTIDADHEIRNLAIEVHRLMTTVEPNLYTDFYTTTISVGGENYLVIGQRT